MEIKRINTTVLEVGMEFYWFQDPDDFDPCCPLDISSIEEMSLEVPLLDGRFTAVQLHGPVYDLATWGTVH